MCIRCLRMLHLGTANMSGTFDIDSKGNTMLAMYFAFGCVFPIKLNSLMKLFSNPENLRLQDLAQR
jgi:hypothetical protein